MKHLEIGPVSLPKVFLGTSPFMGAGQFGEKASGYYQKFYEQPENMLRLMERAVSLSWGIQPFVLPSFMSVLLKLRDRVGDFPVVFSAGMNDLQREIRDISDFSGTLVCVHASVADRSKAAGLEAHFQEILSQGFIPGVVTHSPATTVEEVQGTSCRLIMAPINRLGWAMGPDPQVSLTTMEKSTIPILAKKVLAAGRISPKEGFSHAIEHGVEAICVGAVSEEEIEEDNTLLEELGFI